jgi:hypothetical protein
VAGDDAADLQAHRSSSLEFCSGDHGRNDRPIAI